MNSDKEFRNRIKDEVKEDRYQKRERAKQIKQLPREQRKDARKSEKADFKAAKKQRKKDIRQMPLDEKKAAKKHDKIYKRIKTRPRTVTIWVAIALVSALLIYQAIPLVGGFIEIGGIKLNHDSAEAKQARAYGAKISREIADEGMVLLLNKDNLLPLKNAKINIFGVSSFTIRYGGGGSGAADTSVAVGLYQAFENAGIAYNKKLHDHTKEHVTDSGSKGFADVFLTRLKIGGSGDEPDVTYLTPEILKQAQDFSDTALIVFSGQGVEATDSTTEQLQLSQNKVALMEKVSATFKNVIVIINTGNTMELGFLEKYPNIKAAIWTGTPGPFGMESLADIITGKINPSGRLVDTYAYDVSDNPASVNFGDYKYDNVRGLGFLNYEEGIYVGYRFYETYYENDESGYQKAVQFSFGYGLSYTTFDWEVKDTVIDSTKVSVTVRVTNTGKVAGKDVLQLYYSAPYIQGGIEKSAIELGAYAKTSLLLPGSSETLTLEYDVRDMASYDMKVHKAYVLDAGTYRIKLAKNIHDIVEIIPHTITNKIIYAQDDVTGTDIQNRFDYANGGLTYLSRSNWEGTYPDAHNRNHTASDEFLEKYNQTPEKVTGTMPITGVDNGIMLKDLKGLDYDDIKWDRFIDQFTYKEMADLVTNGAYMTRAIERLGVPGSYLLDGPAGINNIMSDVPAASYPTEVVIASTWNDNLAFRMGEAVAREANALGLHGWYAPAMNIHRTARGGRNFEYFSEDPLLSGKMSAAIVKGAQSRNIIVTMKHFALNDQEINARSGVSVWANEQAIREIYLKPFEITVKEGKVTGVMSSFIIIGHKWAGGNPELLQHILRDEWGFTGLVTTDAVLGGFMDVNTAIRSGNDLMLAALKTRSYLKRIDKLYKQDPVGIVTGLKNSTKNICYSLVNYTTLFD